jgi:hypothetical protein
MNKNDKESKTKETEAEDISTYDCCCDDLSCYDRGYDCCCC